MNFKILFFCKQYFISRVNHQLFIRGKIEILFIGLSYTVLSLLSMVYSYFQLYIYHLFTSLLSSITSAITNILYWCIRQEHILNNNLIQDIDLLMVHLVYLVYLVYRAINQQVHLDKLDNYITTLEWY